MRLYYALPSLACLLAACLPAHAHRIQHPDLQLPDNAAERAQAVRQMFIEAYEAYRRYAFGHDDLRPISRTYTDTRNGWGATLVDALDTMQIMGLTAYYDEALEHIAQTDFTQSATEVNVFETTIRYLAGLLSAYELSGKRDAILLTKATELGDRLVRAWEGTNVMPWTYVFFDDRPIRRNRVSVSSASLILELRTLSKHTGNATYLELAQRAQNAILGAPSPFLGLLPNSFWPPTGRVQNQWTTWGSGCDSAHEYLLKHHLLSDDPRHLNAWRSAVHSSVTHLLVQSTRGDHFLGEYDGRKYLPDAAHLTTFAAGNWLLGGALLEDDEIKRRGLQLLDSAWATHDLSPHGLGPDEYTILPMGQTFAGPRRYRRQTEKLGLHCTNCGYYLRPETIESNFYAWRITGDVKYQERAWRFVQDLGKLQVRSGGFAGVRDVFATGTGRRVDHTESFFYAETLKYAYLTFTPHVSLDHFVFNTEAHPFAFDDAPASAFELSTATNPPSPAASRGARGASLTNIVALSIVACLVLLVHGIARVRGRRQRPSTTHRLRRRDGIVGTGGIARRSKASVHHTGKRSLH